MPRAIRLGASTTKSVRSNGDEEGRWLLTILTPIQAAALLQVPREQVLRLCVTGNLPGARRIGRMWRIPEASIRCFSGLPKEIDFPTSWGSRPSHDTSVIYFIQCVTGGLIKIGRTDDIERRFATIQACCPVRLHVLAIVPGYFEAEKHLHRRFSYCRRHGEWFEASVGLLEFIQGLK